MERINQYIDQMMKQKYLVAMKEGIINAYPFLLVGTPLLLLICPPFSQFSFLLPLQPVLKNIYYLCSFAFSLYAVFSIGFSLGKTYQLNSVQTGLFSVFTFLWCMLTSKMSTLDILSFSLFIGILSTILTVEIIKVSNRVVNWNFLPTCIPPAVSTSFLSLVPFVLVIFIFGIILSIFPIVDMLFRFVMILVNLVDTLPVMLLCIFFVTFFWAMGVHGVTLVSMILRPFWICMLLYNGFVLLEGQTELMISPEPFLQWFVWIGGSGTTLGLSFIFKYLSKSQHCREVGKTSWVSSIFNINEPVVFGAPIVHNRLLMIPFVTVPMICAVITWICLKSGWLSPIRIMAIWTLPSPIGAFLATGGDYRAILLNIFLIVLSMVIYYPFVRQYEQQLQREDYQDE